MPHVIIDYAADIASAAQMQTLCDALFDALAAHPAITRPETLKIRCAPVTAHRLGTKGQGFAHATLLLLPGRDADTKSDLAQTILRELTVHLPDATSLSVNLSDLDASYAKRVLPD
ncbi:5-carboxymethyl-2-hydroxymuconate isomerase [Rhodobacteraceae bacterium KMM 6894]|nr:5-carboxymethyl-2-hydroxymuconate isomerase [Rhodobacteraceae bacterium KMM 6894]